MDIHFPTFSPYSCGDTIGKPQTDRAADVTCLVCRCEFSRLFDGHVKAATDKLAGQIRDIAESLVADHGDNTLAQTRRAMAEAKADGDAEAYALWEQVQIEVLEIGPTGLVYR